LVQIFDSFAGVASYEEFKEFITEPTKKIASCVSAPFIGFPKGCGSSYVEYVKKIRPDIIGVDYSVCIDWAKDNLQDLAIVQGNLDPYLLAFDKIGAVEQTKKIVNTLGKKPFIFNLGHGIYKETPVENVEAVLSEVRRFQQ
jgi:uroporphyrinogen decarboxylase